MPSGSRAGWSRCPHGAWYRCADAGSAARGAWEGACGMRPRLALAAALAFSLIVPAARSADQAGRSLAVTIYADDLALIQDRRDIDVKGGRQRIEFPDVSAQ